MLNHRGQWDKCYSRDKEHSHWEPERHTGETKSSLKIRITDQINYAVVRADELNGITVHVYKLTIDWELARVHIYDSTREGLSYLVLCCTVSTIQWTWTVASVSGNTTIDKTWYITCYYGNCLLLLLLNVIPLGLCWYTKSAQYILHRSNQYIPHKSKTTTILLSGMNKLVLRQFCKGLISPTARSALAWESYKDGIWIRNKKCLKISWELDSYH